MDSVAVLRSFQYAVSTSSLKSVLENPGMVSIKNSSLPIKNIPSTNRHGAVSLSCIKTPETTITAKPNSELNGAALSDSQSEGSIEKKSSFRATFPKGFEGLLAEICDETKIAEVKVKFGDFEMHMKRKIDDSTVSAPAPVVPETTAPPAPSVQESSAPPAPPKSSAEKTSTFKNISEKSLKLAALEASGSAGCVVVASQVVGAFRRAKTVKGKTLKPACKEGDVVKEGQVLGYVYQFGHQMPVVSDVAGEVVKILFREGEPVGYGDPLIAVLPHFHDIGVQ